MSASRLDLERPPGGSEVGKPSENTPLLPDKAALGKAGAGGLAVLTEQFGHKLLIMLFASQHLMKGFAFSFTTPPQQFLYASRQVSAPQIQIYQGVTQLPWAMKPMIGLASDVFPCFGFHKMPYMVFATLLGLFACIMVGCLPLEAMSIETLVACFFLIALMYSTADLLTEAKYAEKMQSKPAYGPSLMSYVWGGLNTGALIATALVGPVMTGWSYQVPFVLAILPIGFILGPLLANFLEERVQSKEEQAVTRSAIFAQYEVCFLCLVMFVGTVSLAFIGILFQSVALNAVASLVVAVVVLISFSVLLRPMIARVNAFFLVQTSLGLSVQGASFYFFTDGPLEYPEGPHFSTSFYISVLGLVSLGCSLVGIYTYQRCASRCSYRNLLIAANVLSSVLNVADVLMFARLNVRLGIPDHFFVLGTGAFASVIDQWMWMPGVVITSQLCPPGMEATMYALLAGCHNLGNTIASNCGAWLLEFLECQPTGGPGETQQFSRLWLASLIATMLPALTVFLTFVLIPDAKQTDKLLPEGDRDATSGSLLRRWLGPLGEPAV